MARDLPNVPARPNIVLIFSDQQHFAAHSLADPGFTTPNLERFAHEATAFTHTFCTTPQCTPSRGSILTGLFPHRTGVLGNIGAAGGSPLAQPTLAHQLSEAGYRVGYFGKWHLGDHPEAKRGFETYKPTPEDPDTVANALAWLNEQEDSDDAPPLAMIVSLNQPHDVYHVDPNTPVEGESDIALPRSWYADDLSGKPPVQLQFLTEDQGRRMHDCDATGWQRYRHAYREAVRDFDQSFGRLYDALQARRDWDRTAAMVFSDHGDMDSHHRLCFKGPFMYDQLVRVPLWLRLPPHMAAVETAHDLVSLVDIWPTVMDLAMGPETYEQRDGQSLLPAALDEPARAQREFVISQYYSKQNWVNPIRMLYQDGWKYTRYRKWGEELYDLTSDADETHNLAGQNQYQPRLEQMRRTLDNWMRENDDNFPTLWPTDREGNELPR